MSGEELFYLQGILHDSRGLAFDAFPGLLARYLLEIPLSHALTPPFPSASMPPAHERQDFLPKPCVHGPDEFVEHATSSSSAPGQIRHQMAKPVSVTPTPPAGNQSFIYICILVLIIS